RQKKSPNQSGIFHFTRRSIFAITTQLQLLAGNASVLELGQQLLEAIFRQLDQAEAVAHLDATDRFAGQAAFVEDRTQQVLGRDTVTRTQRGTATCTTFTQWHRRATLTLATLGALTGRTITTW